MGVFHDELMTFYYYNNTGVIYPPEAHLDANNHFLNSQLSTWTFQLFGPSPLAIRLPNVLAFPFFFYSAFQLAGRFKPTIVRWSFALSLVMCPFTFEYFAMSRGYGLSMMFLLTAIYFCVLLLEKNNIKHLVSAAILLWFGVAANMTVLPYALLIFGFIFIHAIYADFNTDKKKFFLKLFMLFVLGSTFLIHAKWSFEMKEAGLLIHGDLEGLYGTTMTTVGEHLFGKFYWWQTIPVFIIFWSSALFLGAKMLRDKRFDVLFSINGLFIYLLLSAVLLLFALGKLMEINYPRDRTGMHLLIFLFGSLAALSSTMNQWKWTTYFSAILFIFPIQFIYYWHPAESHNFDAGRHSDRIYSLVSDIKHDFDFPLSISSRGFQQFGWYYANYRHDKSQGGTFFTNFPILEADIILKENRDTVPENDSIYQLYDSIYHDPFTHITCFQRKKFLNRKLIWSSPIPDLENVNYEYFNFLMIGADSLVGKSLYVGVEMTLKAEHQPFRSRMVLAVDRDEEPRNLHYDYIQLDWISNKYDGSKGNVKQGVLLSRLPVTGETLAFYLWNPDTTTYSISDGKCYLYEIERDF